MAERLDELPVLTALDALADDAQVEVWVASRALSPWEQAHLCGTHDAWLRRWSAAFGCPASRSQVVLEGRVLVWAVDERPRQARGVTGGLTGTELDPLFRATERFATRRRPALRVERTEALLVDGTLVPFGEAVTGLLAAGQITAETRIVHGCTVDDWRAGRFAPRLADDSVRAEALLRQR